MNEIIQKINKERSQSEHLLEKKKKQWEKLRNEFYELKEKYEKSCSIELLRKKLSGLICELGWALAYNIEQILKDNEEKLTKLLNKQEKNNLKLKSLKESLEKDNQEYKTIKEKISELTDQSKKAKNELEIVNETYKKVAAKHKNVTSETKKLTAFIEKKAKERDDIKTRLEEERKQDLGEQNYEVERRQKEEKIQNIEEKLKEKLEMEKEKIQEYRNFCQELDNSQKSFDEKKHHLKNVDGLIKRLNEDIENLGKSANDQIYRYGNSIAIIVKDINAHYQNRKFKEKPSKIICIFKF
jgi:chromosome segregation ATPase